MGPGKVSREGHSCELVAARITAAGGWGHWQRGPARNQGHRLHTTSCGTAMPCATGKETWRRAVSHFGNEKEELKGGAAKAWYWLKL